MKIHLACDLPEEKVVNITYAEALEFLKQLNEEKFQSCSNWRLPTIKELDNILQFSYREAILVKLVNPLDVEEIWYWTSDTDNISPDFAWIVHQKLLITKCSKEEKCILWPVSDL